MPRLIHTIITIMKLTKLEFALLCERCDKIRNVYSCLTQSPMSEKIVIDIEFELDSSSDITEDDLEQVLLYI